jgi:hypothetical protein
VGLAAQNLDYTELPPAQANIDDQLKLVLVGGYSKRTNLILARIEMFNLLLDSS